MGGAFGVGTQINASSLFVDEVIIKGEQCLKKNCKFRNAFVEFVKLGAWREGLGAWINTPSQINEPPWGRYGYKSPHCIGGTTLRKATNETRVTIGRQKTFSSDNSTDDTSSISKSKYNTICRYQTLQREHIRCLLIAALLPIFLATQDTENCTVDRTMQVYLLSNRLIRWLIDAADMFERDSLDHYLAGEEADWTKDYIGAIQSLTAMVTLSTIDAASQESKIVYSNSVDESQLGANLHEMFAEDCSPGGVQQVAKAVFGAKAYKRGLIDSDGLCRLRAVKPVFNSEGKHAYTLAIESFPFKDSLSDAPFQQVEDLLLLLPLLIRT